MTNSPAATTAPEVVVQSEPTVIVTEQQVTQPDSPEQKLSYLEELIGEGKRYKDAEQVAKAAVEKQKHIEVLEQENKKLRADQQNLQQQTEKRLSSIIEALEKNHKIHAQHSAVPSNSSQSVPTDLDGIVEAKVAERLRLEKMEAISRQSREKLVSTYGSGEKADQAIKALLTAKPYMRNALQELVYSDPEMFAKEVSSYVPVAPQESGKPETSAKSINIPNNSSFMKWSELAELMRTNPKKYHELDNAGAIDKFAKEAQSKGIDYFNT